MFTVKPAPFLCLLAALALLPATPAGAQTSAPKWFDKINFAGDFRLRLESFQQDGMPGRVRPRIRLRAGFTAPISSHFETGFRLATGNPGAVTSANLTLGNGLTNASFTLDRAWLTWKPSDRLAVTAGKFGMAFHTPSTVLGSELVFDSEVPPEGFRQELVAVRSAEGVVRQVTLSGEQWLLRESSSGDDAWMLGGQALVELAPSSSTRLELAGAFMHWSNAAPLAALANSNRELFISNSVITRSGARLDGGYSLSPSSSDPFDRYANEFRVARVNAGLRVDGVGGRPLVGYVDLSRNTAIGANNEGVWVGMSWGQVRRAGDWALGAAWARQEREAFLSAFSYSDLGFGGTNAQGAMVQVTWRPVSELTLQAKHHIITSVLDVAQFPGTLHRLQLDGSVRF